MVTSWKVKAISLSSKVATDQLLGTALNTFQRRLWQLAKAGRLALSMRRIRFIIASAISLYTTESQSCQLTLLTFVALALHSINGCFDYCNCFLKYHQKSLFLHKMTFTQSSNPHQPFIFEKLIRDKLGNTNLKVRQYFGTLLNIEEIYRKQTCTLCSIQICRQMMHRKFSK